MSAFSIPLSGLKAASSTLNVIANNLANLNTDGYKNQTLSFASIFNAAQGTSGNGDPIQTGDGVQVGGTTSNFTNGNLNSTGVASNMALQGNGFFVLQAKNGETNYTRSGDFTINSQGQLCTPAGELVMGYPATNGVVSTTSALKPIVVSQAAILPASASTSFQMNTNLNASSPVGATFSTPITVYDSLGESHVLSVTYTNAAPNSWNYSITLPAADTGGTGAPTQIASGAMTFNSSGVLTSPTGSVSPITITGLADQAAPITLKWSLADSSGNPLITQQNTASATSDPTQNGYTAGTLSGYSVLPDGTVQGQFSNSQTLAIGQVAVATFANNEGLIPIQNNDFEASFGSGAAVVGQASVAGDATITGGSVEQSNVDLAKEFSNMIVAQQGYQASAKVLTTFNQVSQALLQVTT
jgi:flagellar hook protein FlgE